MQRYLQIIPCFSLKETKMDLQSNFMFKLYLGLAQVQMGDVFKKENALFE